MALPASESVTSPDLAQRLLDGLAGMVESALTRLLRLDPGSEPLLHDLDGRQFRLRLRGAGRGIRLRVDQGRVRPVPDSDAEADLAIAIEPSALIAWLAKPSDQRGLPSGARIEGDLDLARVLEKAFAGFDPDWELPFVDVFGVTLGPQIARGLAGVFRQTRRMADDLAASAAEFATEEAALVTASAEIDDFNAEVDRLRDDVDRLAARLSRIEREVGDA